jgi:transposase-like protein
MPCCYFSTIKDGSEMKNSHKQDFWFNHVSQCQNSDLSQKDYCKQEGLKFNTFSFWRVKFLKGGGTKVKENAVSFVPALVKTIRTKNPTQENSEINIFLPNQIKLSVSENLSCNYLFELIRTLSKLP